MSWLTSVREKLRRQPVDSPQDRISPVPSIRPAPPALDLGLALLCHLASERPETNTLISPASVSFGMALVAMGARGSLRESIMSVVCGAGNQSHYYPVLLRAVNSRHGVLLLIANSIWASRKLTLRPEFANLCRESYDAEIASVDFDDAGAPERINSWVREKTRNKIDGIVHSTKPDDAVMLVNAAYFLGRWKTAFDPTLTKQRPFHAPSGTKRHPMMEQHGSFLYQEGPGFQALCLPYSNWDAAMYLFLPFQRGGLPELLARLQEQPGKWMNRFETKQGTVILPRFRSECHLVLENALRTLGLGDVFAVNTCDLSGMFFDAARVFIRSAYHKTLIDVDEQGTEAAAVTSFRIETSALRGRPPKPFHMIVDHPFLLMICDNNTSMLLFAGAVYEL